MYILVSLEKIIYFFNQYGIDITLFSNFEVSVLVILCNIFILLFYIFMFIVIWKLIFKIIGWWF